MSFWTLTKPERIALHDAVYWYLRSVRDQIEPKDIDMLNRLRENLRLAERILLKPLKPIGEQG